MAMAHSFIATHSLSSRFSAPFIDVCSPSSDSYTVSPLSKPIASSFPRSSSSRVLRLNIQEKSRRSSMVKAVYLDGFSASGSSERTGVWSIRDDLTMPSSPHFPVQARGPSGPSPMVQERFQSVISQLFQYRIIRCGGAVDDDMANIIVGQLLYLDAVNPNKKYLESTTVRVEEMRVRRRDTEQWMSHRLLPEFLRARIWSYEQYKWQETRGVDEEAHIRNLPKDLKRDIKRHLCLNLLMRVPMFKKMDEQLMDAMCSRLKPVLYTDKSSILREGDPVDERLFIMRGRLVTMTTNGGRTGFFNSVFLEEGDFCGEELLTWALDPRSSSNLPISTRTVLTITEVEAFALLPHDFKFVASQFRRRLHSKQLRHAFRFYSQQWRSWAAYFIEAGWRQHARRKQENKLRESENSKLQDALAKEGGTSLNFGATI